MWRLHMCSINPPVRTSDLSSCEGSSIDARSGQGSSLYSQSKIVGTRCRARRARRMKIDRLLSVSVLGRPPRHGDINREIVGVSGNRYQTRRSDRRLSSKKVAVYIFTSCCCDQKYIVHPCSRGSERREGNSSNSRKVSGRPSSVTSGSRKRRKKGAPMAGRRNRRSVIEGGGRAKISSAPCRNQRCIARVGRDRPAC